MSMDGNVVDVFKVSSENAEEYIEFEMHITEAPPGSFAEVESKKDVDSRLVLGRQTGGGSSQGAQEL